jgi:hypothetical protein
MKTQTEKILAEQRQNKYNAPTPGCGNLGTLLLLNLSRNQLKVTHKVTPRNEFEGRQFNVTLS